LPDAIGVDAVQRLPWEVVGVIADEKVDNLGGKGDNPGIYVSNQQSPVFFQSLVVRTAMDPSGLKQALGKAVHEINKDQTLTEVKTIDQIKAESTASNRLQSMLLAGIGLALGFGGALGLTRLFG